MLIHRDALVVQEVTTPENTRHFLNGAMFDKEGRSVATDGHVLVRFTGNEIDPAGFPKIDGIADLAAAADVILSREDLRAALATISKNDKQFNPQHLAIVPNGTHVTIATAQLDRTVQIRARKIEGTFPNYHPILVAKKPTIATLVVDPAFLQTIGKMAKDIGARHIKLTLQGDSIAAIEPVLFEAQGTNGKLDGAIMPMRP